MSRELSTTFINMPNADALKVKGVRGTARVWNEHKEEAIPMTIYYNPERKYVMCQYTYYPFEGDSRKNWVPLISTEATKKRMDDLSIVVLIVGWEVKNNGYLTA